MTSSLKSMIGTPLGVGAARHMILAPPVACAACVLAHVSSVFTPRCGHFAVWSLRGVVTSRCLHSAASSLRDVLASAGTSVVASRLELVSAGGHRAPAGAVRPAAVDQKPGALVVGARSQPAR